MYLKSQLTWNVVVWPRYLDQEGLMRRRSTFVNLLSDFASRKVSRDLGYLLAVTTLDSVGDGKIRPSGEVVFPVTFSCISFKMLPGEALKGTVHAVTNLGVVLRCGPVEQIFLSHKEMPGYSYVSGNKPFFEKKNSLKIEVGIVLRFLVKGVSFLETENEFRALARMDGDYLG